MSKSLDLRADYMPRTKNREPKKNTIVRIVSPVSTVGTIAASFAAGNGAATVTTPAKKRNGPLDETVCHEKIQPKG